MCSLCGALTGRPHWTAQAGRHRVAYARELLGRYGLGVTEWQGRYLVTNRRGRTELVDDLGACWVVAERLAGRPVDPLEEAPCVR
jgi:hypothetical protein